MPSLRNHILRFLKRTVCLKWLMSTDKTHINILKILRKFFFFSFFICIFASYIKTMKRRDPMLAKGWGQIVTPLFVQTPGGRQKMNFSTMKGIFRIIQAITSPKAEPFKQWIAQVASERLDQMQDPEKSIDQAIVDYKRLGYSDAWINQRIKSIEVRKELTDEWQRTGVHEGLEYFCQITRKKRNDIPFC